MGTDLGTPCPVYYGVLVYVEIKISLENRNKTKDKCGNVFNVEQNKSFITNRETKEHKITRK